MRFRENSSHKLSKTCYWPRVTRLISLSYVEKTVLLSRNCPTNHLVAIFQLFVSPLRATSLKVSKEICHFVFLSPFLNSFLKISFSSLFLYSFFFFFFQESRMKAVIDITIKCTNFLSRFKKKIGGNKIPESNRISYGWQFE